MDDISNIMGNITVLLAVFGGGLAAVAVAYAGIQWMTASGDPQKMAQVRMGVVGAVGGLVLVGVAFIVPRVVSQLVIEPSGGMAVDWDAGFNCDQVFRDQLVIRRSASNTAGMNALINQVQSQREECSSEVWNPLVKDLSGTTPHDKTTCFGNQAGTLPAALAAVSRLKVGSSVVPRTFRIHTPAGKYTVRGASGRDARNNILVYWYASSSDPADTLPSDGSKCWLYVSRLGVWSENY